MREMERVSELVDGFLEQPLLQRFLIRRQTIELVVQAVRGYYGARPTHLCLAENECENWNVQVN